MEKKEAKKWNYSIWSFSRLRNVFGTSLWRLYKSLFSDSYPSLSGFTLIEIVIVVGIAAILITVFLLFGNPMKQTAKAKDAQRVNDIKQLKAALDLYYDDHKCYPDAIPTDSWVENGVVYMIKVPKDPDIGTAANSGYIYQVDKTDTCPQWNILYATYTSRQYKTGDCALSAMSGCNYTGTMACSISGQVDCAYVSSNPVSGSANGQDVCPPSSPKKYVKDQAGNCNVAPDGEGVYCIEQCGN